ncbi:MAG: hypothetical protein GXX84_20885 [Acidobacteria bacterium]|nr:hypothetical protein [Acidobacteriota bacterium]
MEAEGIPTVVIGSGMFEERLRAMRLPRLLITQFPLGRPLGAPGDARTQRAILQAALDLLARAETPGEVVTILSS